MAGPIGGAIYDACPDHGAACIRSSPNEKYRIVPSDALPEKSLPYDAASPHAPPTLVRLAEMLTTGLEPYVRHLLLYLTCCCPGL